MHYRPPTPNEYLDLRRLREFRESWGTLRDLARKTGFNAHHLGDLEKGRHHFHLSLFRDICRVLALDHFQIVELLRLNPLGGNLVHHFKSACRRVGTTPRQALSDFMRVFILSANGEEDANPETQG